MAMGDIVALDPRKGTKLLVAECCRNLSTVGALPIATTNNLNFGNPERPEIMAQIVESIEGLADACRFFDVPVTGGNVSLYNETLGAPIFPRPCWESWARWRRVCRSGFHLQKRDYMWFFSADWVRRMHANSAARSMPKWC